MIFFNDTATTEIYTLSLHDALPICIKAVIKEVSPSTKGPSIIVSRRDPELIKSLFELEDRKSTRLNSSHANISYAVFCLKKKTAISNLIIYLFILLYSFPFHHVHYT